MGWLDEGTPRGRDTTIAGVCCYFTEPSAAAANGCAVILATDVFGYKLLNARLIADAYADAGYICVVPDYFQGEPMDMQLLEALESLPTQSFLGKIATGLQLALQVVNVVRAARGRNAAQDPGRSQSKRHQRTVPPIMCHQHCFHARITA